MALPTPPHSGKEPIVDSFSANDHKAVYSPLFAPIAQSGRRSPSDALLISSHARHLPQSMPLTPRIASHSVKRAWLEDENSITTRQPPEHTPVKRPRVDSPLDYDAPLFSVRSPPPTRAPHHVEPTVLPSPPSKKDVELVGWFYHNFQTKFLKSVRDPINNTWLVLADAPVAQTPQSKRALQKRRRSSARPEEMDYPSLPSKGSPTRSKATLSHQRHRSLQSPIAQVKGDVKTTRSPANKALVSKDYNDWPDFSPGPTTLDHARHIADNMPQMSGRKDLSTDTLKHELHPVELIAAHHAGVDCARYLVTKRSVFVGYTKHLLYKHNKRELTSDEIKKGLKSWNKTAAQNCSSIDVNKTSTLFADFWQKVDWFNEKHFKDIIDGVQPANFPIFDKDGRRIDEQT